jgi:pimeloyl-ACP methyl ester carboxylesterase
MLSILVFAAVVIAVIAIVAVIAPMLVRLAFRIRDREHASSPARFRLPAETVRIPTANGKTLFGWWLDVGRHAPTLVFVHGWGANSASGLPFARSFLDAGYNLLLIDARGHGRSDTDTFASMPRFAEDSLAAVDFLAARGYRDPVLIGHSVGGAAVLLAASMRSSGIGGVVTLGAFAHPHEVMRRWLRSHHVTCRPVAAWVLRYVERTIGHRFDDIAPVNTIARVGVPTLIVHGLADRTVPANDARRLHRANGASTLLLLPGVGHDRAMELKPHLPRIIAWLDQAVRGGGSGPSSPPGEVMAAGDRITGNSDLCSIPREN